MSLIVKLYNDITVEQIDKLKKYLDNQEEKILPYHLLEFMKFTEVTFKYTNVSLVVFDNQMNIVGYVPQWIKGNVIESVTWRDKGGPIFNNDACLKLLVNSTKHLVKENNCKGFIWKDFKCEYLNNYNYFINVDVNISKLSKESLRKIIRSTVRNRIKIAENNNLNFVCEKNIDDEKIKIFFNLFLNTRKRLGVPAFSIKFFKNYFNYIESKNIKLFNVYKDNEVLSSLIVLHTKNKAIYSYPASCAKAFEYNANDFMIYNLIKYCIDNDIKGLDYGADSPMQKGLIRFKLKWCGHKREVCTSYWGNVKELDHNIPKYNLYKKIIKHMPDFIYKTFSKMIIK